MKNARSKAVLRILVSLTILVLIIGFGIGLVGRSARDQSEALQTRVTAVNVITALRDYRREYDRFPVTLEGVPLDFRGPLDHQILGALTGTDSLGNPRGKLFLGAQTLTGLTRDSGVWHCVDAWGQPYILHIQVLDPKAPQKATIELISAGPDEKMGGADDLKVDGTEKVE